MKKRKPNLELEKKLCNEEWDMYLSNLTKENYNKDLVLFHMQKMNNMDYILIENKRRDLLG